MLCATRSQSRGRRYYLQRVKQPGSGHNEGTCRAPRSDPRIRTRTALALVQVDTSLPSLSPDGSSAALAPDFHQNQAPTDSDCMLQLSPEVSSLPEQFPLLPYCSYSYHSHRRPRVSCASLVRLFRSQVPKVLLWNVKINTLGNGKRNIWEKYFLMTIYVEKPFNSLQTPRFVTTVASLPIRGSDHPTDPTTSVTLVGHITLHPPSV